MKSKNHIGKFVVKRGWKEENYLLKLFLYCAETHLGREACFLIIFAYLYNIITEAKLGSLFFFSIWKY
jgi:hypothetical protein